MVVVLCACMDGTSCFVLQQGDSRQRARDSHVMEQADNRRRKRQPGNTRGGGICKYRVLNFGCLIDPLLHRRCVCYRELGVLGLPGNKQTRENSLIWASSGPTVQFYPQAVNMSTHDVCSEGAQQPTLSERRNYGLNTSPTTPNNPFSIHHELAQFGAVSISHARADIRADMHRAT